MDDERVPITLEQALTRIGPKERVHTFVQAGFAMIGADWDRADVIAAIEKYGIEESGPSASAMRHKLVILDSDMQRAVFIEAD